MVHVSRSVTAGRGGFGLGLLEGGVVLQYHLFLEKIERRDVLCVSDGTQ